MRRLIVLFRPHSRYRPQGVLQQDHLYLLEEQGEHDEGSRYAAIVEPGVLTLGVARERLFQMTTTLMQRRSRLRMRLGMARAQILTAELTVAILDLRPGNGRGEAPALESTGADPDVALSFFFIFLFFASCLCTLYCLRHVLFSS